MIQSVVQFHNGKVKSLHCSTDAVKAEAAFNKSKVGVVTWYRLANHGGDVFRRFDHVASAAQAKKAAAAVKQVERDAEVRAEEERAYRIKQVASDAATKAVAEGLDADGIAKAVTASVEAVDAPGNKENLSPQDKEPGEDASPSGDPGSTSSEDTETTVESTDEAKGESE